MKKYLLQIILCFCLFNIASVRGQVAFDWATQIGDTTFVSNTFGIDVGTDIISDVNGNVYAVGVIHGNIDFDPGPGTAYINALNNAILTAYLVKYDQSGNLIWVKAFQSPSNNGSSSSCQAINISAQGDLIITGQFTNTIDFDPGNGVYTLTSTGTAGFIVKLDASGNFIWAKMFDGLGGYVEVPVIKTDAVGNLYLTGQFGAATIDFDPGSNQYLLTAASGYFDIFYCKLTSQGNFVWAKKIGGNSQDFVYSMTIDNNGNIYSTGSFRDTVDFDPNVGIHDMIAPSNGLGSRAMFINKIDANGNFMWVKQIDCSFWGVASGDDLNGIALDMQNNIYITGCFRDSIDIDPGIGVHYLHGNPNTVNFFISKYDINGIFLWATSTYVNSSSGASGSNIQVDTAGNIYTSGGFVGTVDFDPGSNTYNLTSPGSGIFLSKLDSSGNFLLAESFGGIGDNSAEAFYVGTSGDIYFTGSFTNTSYFDPSILVHSFTATSYYDSFVLKWIENNQTGMLESTSPNNNILVYPNPSNGQFIFNGLDKESTIEIYDITGRLIYTAISQGTSENIDLSNKEKGIYLYKIISDKEEMQQGKIIIQ